MIECVNTKQSNCKSVVGIMSNQVESIQIDAFNTNLHSCRILCQGPFPNQKYPPIMESIQQLREPFKKKILLTRTAFSLSKYIPLQYDGVFQVKDAQDWSLIVTYITYAPKPLLVVAEEIQIPDGLWQKMNRAVTFVNITSTYVSNIRPYDAIFFAPVEELSSSYSEYIFKVLQSVYKASYTLKEHKEVIQELRIAKAGIAWTRFEEDTQGGNMYWYDPVESNQGDSLSNRQMSELFGWLSDQFKRD
jgi:hypothetical protein